MKSLLMALALASLPSQDARETALYGKCDSEIPWIDDGTRLQDRERVEPHKVDRAALLREARRQAAERNRLILWYCPRQPGRAMYRGQLLDAYMKVAVFTDAGVVDLIKAKFVPLRMSADETTAPFLGGRFEFVEPGFLILTPEGELLHRLDRIRTFNADWIRTVLVRILKKHEKYNAPAGESVEDLIRGGDDERALARATPDQKARIYLRAGRASEVHGLGCAPIYEGLAYLQERRMAEARRILERETSPEAIYPLAAIDSRTGKDPEPRWRELVEKFPESRWAWRAASNLVRGRDTCRAGPMAQHVEDFFFNVPVGIPTSTRLAGENCTDVVRRAVEFLLGAQGEDGAWRDTRYAYWPDAEILPNVVTAVTALAALALIEWRDVDPAAVDAAVARAEQILLSDASLNRGRNEECYADAYRLLYFARKKDAARMNELVRHLADRQQKDGFWAHEYPNPFATAAVVNALIEARKAGADVPDALFRKAAEALRSTRGEGGRQAYEAGVPPGTESNSMARSAACELALYECGQGSRKDVAAAIERYWTFVPRLEAVRGHDFHADGGLGGFYFFHGVFHTSEAARVLDEPQRIEQRKKFRAQILAIPEFDGSFVDSHELGKSYGTAMALLILSRTR